MSRRSAFLLAIVMAVAVASGTFAQSLSTLDSLTASLSQEEQLLGSTKPITAADMSRLEALVAQIRAAKSPALLSRAELMLTLFKERETTKTSTAAFNKAIALEASLIRDSKRHQTTDVLTKAGFWTGLSSLALVGTSQVLLNWASDRFVQQQTASAATPYFITGQITQLTTAVGAIGAIGGLSMAWLLSINPFDIPAPLSAMGVPYPRAGMTTAEKANYLETTKERYEELEPRAQHARKVSLGFLIAGLTGALATGVAGYLGNVEYQRYTLATSAADATAYRNTVTTYEYIMIGSASLAFLGLTGAISGYLVSPSPAELSSSIQALDNQLITLQGGR